MYEATLPLLCSLTEGARLCLSGVPNGFVPGLDWGADACMEVRVDMLWVAQ